MAEILYKNSEELELFFDGSMLEERRIALEQGTSLNIPATQPKTERRSVEQKIKRPRFRLHNRGEEEVIKKFKSEEKKFCISRSASPEKICS